MKIIITNIFILIGLINVNAQIVDTIEVSYTKSAYLIFSEIPIFDKGSEAVRVRKFENKLIIQANDADFEETNLFVQSGSDFYIFILRYTETPTKFLFNYQVKGNSVLEKISNSAIKKISVNKNETTPSETKKNTNTQQSNDFIDHNLIKEEKLKEQGEGLFKKTHEDNFVLINKKKQNIHNKGSMKNKIYFIATNFYVSDNYFYLKVFIKNQSRIKYDIDIIRFTHKNIRKGLKKAVDQYTEIEPLYIYNDSIKDIPGKENNFKIFVFEKFTIENHKRFNVEIWEKNGDRQLEFDFFSDDILNIKKLD